MYAFTMDFSTEKLIQLLDNLLLKIKDGKLSFDDQEILWDQITKDVDPEMVKYLFTGWYLHTQLPHNQQQ